MKPVQKILVIATALCVLALAAPAARAQFDALKGTTPEQRAKVQTELMKKKLDLSADEVPKVEAINLKYAQQMEPFINGSAGPLKDFRELRKSDQSKDAELKEVLTADQFTKFLAAKVEMRQEFSKKIFEKK